MTEKELYCLAWHFKCLREAYIKEEQPKLACPTCKYVKECLSNGGITYHFEMMHALEEQTEIKFFGKDEF